MTREGLLPFIRERYSAEEDYPWIKYPDYAVFRHRGNRKWFALLMKIPKSKLGLEDGGMLDVLNVKCDPVLMGALREEKGVYPAYHMSKASWLTIALEGGLAEDQITGLLDLSYELTAPKKKRREMVRPHG